ncbi:MAG: pyridoxamine 5'-phosphate oxidase [Alphaproteobacteria bacterium]|nr:pyridoxamine 5'-phosphate oxidase [Alphaproteobacteria bacterium]
MNTEQSYPVRPPISGDNPFELFRDWFADAEKNEINDPNAMALASVGEDGAPSIRIVLLKSYDENGFCFFTNTLSRKGEQLKHSPHAALCFHWKSSRRQVRIEGRVQPVSEKEADDYFNSRPRGSQIGAWASLQSSHLDSREMLEKRVKEFEEKYHGMAVPRPPHWSGYRVVPTLIEFWQDMPFRLHDRVIFTHDAKGAWQQERWYP